MIVDESMDSYIGSESGSESKEHLLDTPTTLRGGGE
jgi:hypothetical protein